MDVTNITLPLFTVFSSLRIISYVPQIRRVAIDGNGASAISYATWGLWTGANIATALYAAINLNDFYLSAVSSIYALCCIVVIVLTSFKRGRRRLFLRAGATPGPGTDPNGNANLEALGNANLEALQRTVREVATALAENRRPHYAFEHDLAAQARRIVWHDLKTIITRARPAAMRNPQLT